MIFIEGIINGLREVWAHKLRSFLSMIGIILGVASLVAMMGLIEGMVQTFMYSFEETGGIKKLSVNKAEPPEEQQKIASRSRGLTLDDAIAIEQACPLAAYVSPKTELGWERVMVRNNNRWIPVHGVTPDLLPVEVYKMEKGRFISDTDIDQAAPVAVIGQYVKDKFFSPDESAVGHDIRINNVRFIIIGELYNQDREQEGRNDLGWKHYRVFIPITTAMKRFRGNDSLTHLDIQTVDAESITDLVPQIENVLLKTHRGIKDFQVVTREEELEKMREMQRSFSLSLGSVAAISLLVGGIGIMNVMFAAINERIREIGVRKALGARAIDIFAQFLAEAFVISALGGLIGLAISGGVISILADSLPAKLINIVLPTDAMILGFLFSTTVGVVSGIFPAIKAANLDPITALRYE